MEFKDFLRMNFHLGDKSVKDYITRWNGILNKGLYNGETELTPSLVASVDGDYPEDSHHHLTLKRYIEFQNKQKQKSQ
ncbi:hypothetical protein IRV22_15630 [Bacillus cereus]|uniref:hypothetical protein n=1 Tax=Bacillus cereus TaxID=1396 RepID=UPI0019283146|nr:hypothetical protein [Bacillus cereus]MBL3889149.1 hypothetical protein [Bacillus cereus]